MSTYAKIALENGFVPILEPEVLMDGNHTIEKCHTITSQVLRHLFEILQKEGVDEVNIILKCNMVLPGDTAKIKVPPQEAERHTIEVLSTSVPRDVGGIVFLSGGQSTLEATLNLNAIGQIKSAPWPISFSFDRAFVLPVLHIWQGHNQNIPNAQKKLLEAVKGTSQALVGKYQL